MDKPSIEAIDIARWPAAVVAEAHRLWASRVRSEYQSIQIATRLLSETLAAGESFETHRIVLDMVKDELRHAELCADVCRALGTSPPSPSEVAAPLPALGEVPVSERLLASAISLFLVNETFSVAYIRDLAARCQHPVIGPVLSAIGGDEDEHEAFGETFVQRRLANENETRREQWCAFTDRLVQKHLSQADGALANVPEAVRDLAMHPEQSLADLGLVGPVRLALITKATWSSTLAPRLQRLGLSRP